MFVSCLEAVTVFGGAGFLGRRIVRHLRDSGLPFGSRRGTDADQEVAKAPNWTGWSAVIPRVFGVLIAKELWRQGRPSLSRARPPGHLPRTTRIA
jgi:hypothetical protein